MAFVYALPTEVLKLQFTSGNGVHGSQRLILLQEHVQYTSPLANFVHLLINLNTAYVLHPDSKQ